MLHEFLTENTQEIIKRARAKVATRTNPMPTDDEMKHGVPVFLSQLIDRLRLTTTDSLAIEASANTHGGELHALGFTLSQVVHGYGDVCQATTQLAEETHAPITVEEFQTLNMCLDDAIARSVTGFQRRRDNAVAHHGTERLEVVAQEMGDQITAGLLAYSILRRGTVGIGGSTGAVLGRSLRALRDLVNYSLAGVRVESALLRIDRVSVSKLIAELEVEASVGAELSGLTLVVVPIARHIDVKADPQILSAAIGHLLHNAFRFSCSHGRVEMRATETAERVLIEIEDQCGGLAPGGAAGRFLPSEELKAKDLGLSISRGSIEAIGGRIGVRDLPGKGCVFFIDLPRMAPAEELTLH